MTDYRRMSTILPDGRAVLLRSEGPEGNWVARLDDQDREVSGRSLRDVLRELIGISEVSPRWLLDLVGELTAYDTPVGPRYACPCCDFLTLERPPPGTHAICPVCRWEDDNLQFIQMDRPGGANKLSLRQARENFRRIGKSDPARRGSVRPPLPEEQP